MNGYRLVFEDSSSGARLEMAAYLLQEIAGRDGDGGLPVESRRSLAPDDDELEEAFALLEERGLAVRIADRYVLSPLMRLRAPRSPDGSIAMGRQLWIRLCSSLDLGGS